MTTVFESLSEANGLIPYGRRKEANTLEDWQDDIRANLGSAKSRIVKAQKYLDDYPTIKDAGAESFWLSKSNCGCPSYEYNGSGYDLWYCWLTFDQIKETVETLKTDALSKECELMSAELDEILADDKDEFSKLYRLRDLDEKAKWLVRDLDHLNDKFWKNYGRPDYYKRRFGWTGDPDDYHYFDEDDEF